MPTIAAEIIQGLREFVAALGGDRVVIRHRPVRVQEIFAAALATGDWREVYRRGLDHDYGLTGDEQSSFRDWLSERPRAGWFERDVAA